MDNLIYDIGMHTGQDTQYYLKLGYSVLAIEANPLLVEEAKIKFRKELNSGKLRVLNVGISDKEGILPFYKNLRLSEWSSFDKDIGTRNNSKYDVIDVQCITTKKLFELYGIPFYMKIDIEGYDHFCLTDIPDDGDKPRYVSCEACSVGWLDILYEKGYSKFKVISQGDNHNPIDIKKEKRSYYPVYQKVKNNIKSKLQDYIEFKSYYGSSGPFAEMTKGEWMSLEEAKHLYNGFYFESGKALNNVSWFDFHASL